MAYRDSRFAFLLPLKARASCGNWPDVLERLNTTLTSLLNQNHGGFRAIIACQDEPTVDAARDPRVEWLKVDAVPPAMGDPYGGNGDKRIKVMSMGVLLREQGADDFYAMVLDADDLVHRDVVRTVLATDNRHGHIMHTGYFYDVETGRLTLLDGPQNRFFSVCGSGCIAYVKGTELPRAVDDKKCYYARVTRQARAEEEAEKFGRPFPVFEYPATVYLMNHHESQQFQKKGARVQRGSALAADDQAQILQRDFAWMQAAQRIRESGVV